MNVKVFSVFDTKLAVFGNIWNDSTAAAAIRGFSDMVNDPNPRNQWRNHPEDFALYQVAEFDTDSGRMTEMLPVNLCTASSVKTVIPPDRQTLLPLDLNGRDKDSLVQ